MLLDAIGIDTMSGDNATQYSSDLQNVAQAPPAEHLRLTGIGGTVVVSQLGRLPWGDMHIDRVWHVPDLPIRTILSENYIMKNLNLKLNAIDDTRIYTDKYTGEVIFRAKYENGLLLYRIGNQRDGLHCLHCP